jgi:HTH-type transcriptional regulator, sugar sensing transcriptional regulator
LSILEMGADAETIDSLRKLGLNQYEARAYCALNKFGEHTAGQLSETAEVPRPRVYDVLERLQGKGFVAIQQGRPVKYRALPIGEAVVTLRKHRETDLTKEIEAIEKIGEKLSSKLAAPESTNSLDKKNKVWLLKGREAIYSKIGNMIESSNEHVLISSHADGMKRKLKAHKKVLNSARNRGVKIRVVSPIQKRQAEKIAHEVNSMELPTRMVVADDQSMLFLSGRKASADEETGVWLNSPHFAETLKKLVK